MGLDIAVYEGPLKWLDGQPREVVPDEFYDNGYLHVWNDKSFTARAGGIKEGWYDATCTLSFRAGSYSGYNRYREQLSMMALGVSPETVWGDADKYRHAAFWPQINFSDCEGTIGGKVAEALAIDYLAFAPQAKKYLDEYHAQTYQSFREAFSLAANTDGVVVFT